MHVWFKRLASLIFGGEDDVAGLVEEFGDGFSGVILVTEVRNINGCAHFTGEIDGDARFFDDLPAYGFLGIAIRQFERAVDGDDLHAKGFTGAFEFGNLGAIVIVEAVDDDGELDALDAKLADTRDVLFSKLEFLIDGGGDGKAGIEPVDSPHSV